MKHVAAGGAVFASATRGAEALPNDGKRRRTDAVAHSEQESAIEWHGEVTAPTRNGEVLWDFSAGLAGAPPISGPSACAVAPSPSAELLRARAVSRFRQRYAAACKEALFLEAPPADSLDRWMLEQLAQPRSAGEPVDPLFPKPGLAETSRVLLRELLAEVPLRCPTRAWGVPAFKALERYHASAQRWLGHLPDPEELHVGVESLGAWLESHRAKGTATARRNPRDCPFKRRLHELLGSGGLSSQFHMKVEPIALSIISIVSKEARAVIEQLQREVQDDEASPPVLVEAPAMGEAIIVRFKDDEIQMSKMHLFKLRRLYEMQHPCSEDPALASTWEDSFLRSLYVMLRRYVTFIGLDPAVEGLRGGNMHAAAPESVFAWLRRELDVRCETFASPLNCYFPRFFSAFPDVDAAFGSLGSFFHAEALPEGSYEVGPPYTEEVMELTARSLLRLLRGAGPRALSFVLFVPDWQGCGALELLGGEAFADFRRIPGGSPFLLACGRAHRYISGVQFFADVGGDAARRYYVVPHGTRVYVLQSEAAAARWPFTELRARALLESMQAGPP